jgi:thiol-disulfide isomerase/thioredoxin
LPRLALRTAGWSLVATLGAVGVAPARAGGLPTLEERLHDTAGQIVVVNFWAAWCGPCKKELPLLAQLQREYEGRGVRFVGASADAKDERDAAEGLVAASGVSYPVVFGLSDVEMRRLGLGSLLPATAVFDRDGTRAFRIIGEVTRKRLVARLEWLLGPRTGEPPKELQLPPGVDRAPYQE